MKNSQIFITGLLSFAILLVLVCTWAIAGVGVYSFLALRTTSQPVVVNPIEPSPTNPLPVSPIPTQIGESTDIPSPTQAVDQVTPGAVVPKEPAVLYLVPYDTLETLENNSVPINNLIDLAERLENKQDLPESLEFPAVNYQVGSGEAFWVLNTESNEIFQTNATLRYATDHVFFWIQDGVSYNESHLKALVETFENQIYPKNRDFFGSEWNPGVDADPHLYILYAKGLGGAVAGYFSTSDEYLPIVRQYSNAHEMFFLSADKIDLDAEYAYGVLAHEFQHMIHWHRDRNEETWINEGFANLAMLLNGYSVGGSDRSYVKDPDMQLNDWPTNPSARSSHYGAAFLFLTYFLDRFGEQATKSLVAEPANGMVGIDHVLQTLDISDPITNEPVLAEDVFRDWIIASYLQDENIADGRYTYNNYSGAPKPSPTETINSCPQPVVQRDVSQYGADYIQIVCRGDYTFHFEAPLQVGVIPVEPYSGSYLFYSNRGDESDMTLTRTFDFSAHSAPLTLAYWTWFDIEKDYDYVYLTASLDGENWHILTTPSGTGDDPSGNSFGWAYNGLSAGGPQWIQENVDISMFAGKQVQLRFEYVTDGAVNGEGFLIDDIAIPEINYFTDLENDDGGWQAAGFVRIQNILPQTFRLALIKNGRNTQVEHIELPAQNVIDIPISIGEDFEEVILVVSGTTRYTRQRAIYQYSIQP